MPTCSIRRATCCTGPAAPNAGPATTTTPEGPVFNTAAELANARTGLGYFGDRAFASLSLTFEDSRFGLPFEDIFHSHGHAADGHGHDHGHDEEEEARGEDDVAIDLTSRRRVGRFDLGLRNLNNDFLQGVRTGFHVIDVADDHVDTIGGADNIDSRISNRTYIKRTLFYQRQLGRFSGRFGAELKFRDFHATGAEVLAPRTDQSTLSAFGYEELSFGRFRLQLAGRAERNDYKTAARVGLPAGTLRAVPVTTPTRATGSSWGCRARSGCTPTSAPRRRSWPTSCSRSASRHSRSSTTSDRTWGTSRSATGPGRRDDARPRSQPPAPVRPRRDRPEYLCLRHRELHLRNHTTEVVNNLRVLDIIQSDSRFVGFDARGSVRLGGRTWASLGIGYVNATLTATNEAVPRIPPLRATLSVDIPYGAFTVSPELMLAARQDRVFRDETATPGYAVLNLDASYIWPRQHMAHMLSFTGYNLTNALFRNHMSFIKDLAPEMGRGVKVGYSLRFF